MLILVVNAGSSSLKYQVRDTSLPEAEQMLTSGLVENIGTDVPNHEVAFDIMSEKLEPVLHGRELQAVGHRVVQGAEKFTHPTLLTEEVVQQIDDLSPLAPLHNPAHVQGMRAAMHKWPSLPQVAIFDTAFHSTMPEEAWRYAIPYDLADKYSIRRYGFHGTSHEYVSRQVPGLLDNDPSEVKQITLHLGNGASASAIDGGKAVDTSMGLTPLAGLVMGTRTGDIDPGIIFHLTRSTDMDIDEIDNLLNRKSGLKGMAGVNDFRELRKLIDDGDKDAKLAYDVYIHTLRRFIGSYMLNLGGVDAITFTAGVGENAVGVRRDALAGLENFGIEIDDARNANEEGIEGAREISTDNSKVKVFVVPTNEELAIARYADELANQA